MKLNLLRSKLGLSIRIRKIRDSGFSKSRIESGSKFENSWIFEFEWIRIRNIAHFSNPSLFEIRAFIDHFRISIY